jgi:hypothetical protein
MKSTIYNRVEIVSKFLQALTCQLADDTVLFYYRSCERYNGFSWANDREIVSEMNRYGVKIREGRLDCLLVNNKKMETEGGRTFYSMVLQAKNLITGEPEQLGLDPMGLAYRNGSHTVDGYMYWFVSEAKRDEMFALLNPPDYQRECMKKLKMVIKEQTAKREQKEKNDKKRLAKKAKKTAGRTEQGLQEEERTAMEGEDINHAVKHIQSLEMMAIAEPCFDYETDLSFNIVEEAVIRVFPVETETEIIYYNPDFSYNVLRTVVIEDAQSIN